jgi:hypothetical protein
MINLTQVLKGESGLLRDYLEVTHDGVDSVLRLDSNGDGSGFADASITLAGHLIEPEGLADLLENHNLIVDDLYLSTSVTVLSEFAALDHGHHGVSNILRYAFRLDPVNPDRSKLPQVAVRDGYLSVDVPTHPGATDIDAIVEVSENLITWSSASGNVETVQSKELGGNSN